ESLRALSRDDDRKPPNLEGPWHLGAPLALDLVDQIRGARWMTQRCIDEKLRRGSMPPEKPGRDVFARLEMVDRWLEAPSAATRKALLAFPKYAATIGEIGR